MLKLNTPMKAFANIWLHIVLWVLMLFYFVFAPDLYTLFLTKNGKPLQIDGDIPAESDRIHFVMEDLVPYGEDGEDLYELIGLAFIVPEAGISYDLFVPEIALVSNERKYFFSVRTVYRQPDLPEKFAGLDLDFNKLGLSVLIAEDAIQTGMYRIGIIFRNTSDGSAYYWDKPVYYLVKTPNTLRLESK